MQIKQPHHQLAKQHSLTRCWLACSADGHIVFGVSIDKRHNWPLHCSVILSKWAQSQRRPFWDLYASCVDFHLISLNFIFVNVNRSQVNHRKIRSMLISFLIELQSCLHQKRFHKKVFFSSFLSNFNFLSSFEFIHQYEMVHLAGHEWCVLFLAISQH